MTSALFSPHKPLRQAEFVALTAMLFAIIAFSIDSMLPALTEMGRVLSPNAPERAPLILTAFVFGMGVGTLLAGPLADAFGRRTVILAGAAIYGLGALAALAAPTLEWMVLARLLQGLGVAGPRIAVMAMVRDQYKGRDMARIMSFAMMVFTLVPAAAPLLGQAIMTAFGWRSIFGAFILFAGIGSLWLALRQPETLPRAARVPLQAGRLWRDVVEVVSHPVVRTTTVVQTLVFAILFGSISSVQPIFTTTYAIVDNFPLWFAVIALASGGAGFLNASLVGRLGMRRMIVTALGVQAVVSGVVAVLALSGIWPQGLPFALFFVWIVGVFFTAGMTLGNLMALSLEPMGHIAGLAASVTSAIATMASALLATPIGLAFDGTAAPLALAVAVLAACGVGVMRLLPKR